MVDRLIEILGKEAGVFEDFLLLLERQQKALVTNNLDEIRLVTELQQEKLVESQLLSKQRESVIEEIKKANLVEEDLTVSRLIKMVDHYRADQLTKLRKSILMLNDRIIKTRNQNAMLLNKSREYIHRMMDMLSKVGKPEAGYTTSGTEQSIQVNVAVDRRA
jgi:hypothetical protein